MGEGGAPLGPALKRFPFLDHPPFFLKIHWFLNFGTLGDTQAHTQRHTSTDTLETTSSLFSPLPLALVLPLSLPLSPLTAPTLFELLRPLLPLPLPLQLLQRKKGKVKSPVSWSVIGENGEGRFKVPDSAELAAIV